MGKAGKLNSPVITARSPDLIGKEHRFLIDTGSELNILKSGVLRYPDRIKYDKIYGPTGIGDGFVPTLVQADISIEGLKCEVNWVRDNFLTEWDGILGVDFLRAQNAVLSFADGKLTAGNEHRESIFFLHMTRFFCGQEQSNLSG